MLQSVTGFDSWKQIIWKPKSFNSKYYNTARIKDNVWSESSKEK
jgi:hypothetical protein